jgi:hypothetical protein
VPCRWRLARRSGLASGRAGLPGHSLVQQQQQQQHRLQRQWRGQQRQHHQRLAQGPRRRRRRRPPPRQLCGASPGQGPTLGRHPGGRRGRRCSCSRRRSWRRRRPLQGGMLTTVTAAASRWGYCSRGQRLQRTPRPPQACRWACGEQAPNFALAETHDCAALPWVSAVKQQAAVRSQYRAPRDLKMSLPIAAQQNVTPTYVSCAGGAGHCCIARPDGGGGSSHHTGPAAA